MVIKRKIYIFFLIFFLLVAGGLSGCQSSYPEISLEPAEDTEATTAPTPQYQPSPPEYGDEETFLRLSIAPVTSPPQTRENYRKLLSYLPEQLDFPVELVLRTTHAEINQLLKTEHCDAALIGSWSYVEMEESGIIERLVVPEIKGERSRHSYIIVPADSEIENLEDLQNRDFVFTDPMCFSGKQYAVYLLQEMGKTPESFFSDYIYSYSHYNSIIAVAENWVTAAAVDSNVYQQLLEEDPALEDKVKIIDKSPPIGNPPVVINSQLPPELQEKIKETFLAMHEDEEGQKALKEMNIDRFVRGNSKDYDTLREIKAKLEGES